MYANFRRHVRIKIDQDIKETEAAGWGTVVVGDSTKRVYFTVEQSRFLRNIDAAGVSSLKLQFIKQGYQIESVTIKTPSGHMTYKNFARVVSPQSSARVFA